MNEEQVAKHKGLSVPAAPADHLHHRRPVPDRQRPHGPGFFGHRVLRHAAAFDHGRIRHLVPGIELAWGGSSPRPSGPPQNADDPVVQYASAALVIIGIFVMRFIIVIGGQSVPMF